MPTSTLSAHAAPYAPFVLRVGMAAVILWFGAQQILSPDMWVSWVPAWTEIFGVSPERLVFLNGSFELLAGTFLLAGFYTRFFAALLAVHMFFLVFEFGMTPVGVRDFGLAMGLLTLALDDRAKWTLT